MGTTSLYDHVVSITYDYLGPAADRFVSRQIHNHLQKDPVELHSDDLRDLIEWIRLAMNLLSDDRVLVEKYIADLLSLTSESHGN